MIRVVYQELIEEVSVLKTGKRVLAQYKRHGWVVYYEGKYGVALRKTTIKQAQ